MQHHVLHCELVLRHLPVLTIAILNRRLPSLSGLLSTYHCNTLTACFRLAVALSSFQLLIGRPFVYLPSLIRLNADSNVRFMR